MYRFFEINIFRKANYAFSVITFYENDKNHLNQET